jgi:hypothetical protein
MRDYHEPFIVDAPPPVDRSQTQPAYVRKEYKPLRRKPVGKIPPVLQTGYSDGVPPFLRARHSSAVLMDAESYQTVGAVPNYSRPIAPPGQLVDITNGLFLNAYTPTVHYRQHRIPTPVFPDYVLQDEVDAELTQRQRPSDEKEVFVAPERPVSRAWMSPNSPVTQNTYEMEAGSPGFSIFDAKLVEISRPKAPPRIASVEKKMPDHPSVPYPEHNDMGSYEYNWPRFSDVAYVDPATEHSDRYRHRMRRLKRTG